MDFDIDKVIGNLIETSKQMEASAGGQEIDERNELKCLKLYAEGWKQDGFDFVSGTQDIITYWKKEGTEERKQVRLIPEQQRRWIRELERRQKRGEIK
jgi:hypothetical protein